MKIYFSVLIVKNDSQIIFSFLIIKSLLTIFIFIIKIQLYINIENLFPKKVLYSITFKV